MMDHQQFKDEHKAASFALRLSRGGRACILNTDDGRLIRYEPKTGAAQLVS